MSMDDEVYEVARAAARDEVDNLDLMDETAIEGAIERYISDLQEQIDTLTHQLEQALESSAERINLLFDHSERIQRLEHTLISVQNPYVGPSRPDVVAHLNDEQRRCIFGLLSELTNGVQMNRETRLKIVGYAAGRNIISFNELTEFEADEVIGGLDTVLFVNRQVGK